MRHAALLAALLAAGGLSAPAWPQEQPLAAAFEQARAFLPKSSLSFGRCALGPAEACFALLVEGLAPEDRPFVRLAGAEIVVDGRRRSASPNFRALQKVAGRRGDQTEIEVLSPAQSFAILIQNRYPGPFEPVATLMGSPKTNDGFEGYTFFPYNGTTVPGVSFSTGRAVLVLVNTDQSPVSIVETFHHELRHVLMGDFGRRAAEALHGLPAVERATRAAEEEARLNAGR